MQITREDEKKIEEVFNAFDKDGSNSIEPEELRMVLEIMGEDIPEHKIYHMMAEAGAADTGQINYEQFKAVILRQKTNQSLSNEEDTLDAFVSLEGNPDTSGHVDAKKLIKIIKEDFEMTIDIEKLI